MFKTLILSSLFVATAVCAHNHEGKDHKGHGPCHEEMKTHCGNAEGRDAKMKCLEENKDKFSQECKDNMEKMKAAMQEVQEACKADIETHCKGLTPGNGLMKCMKQNKKKFSEACREEMKEKKKMRKKMKKDQS